MAPVSLESHIRYAPIILAGSHLAAVGFFTYTIGLGLFRSHKALGPAQDTRSRTSHRQNLTIAFGSLAALSLVFAVTSGISYLTLSYRVWASARGIGDGPFRWHMPTLDKAGIITPGLYLASWLSDTPIYRDALEIVTEKARRLWWAEQVDLSSVAWSMLLTIEGRRRKIPYLWAYALLAQLVNLSFAQNLFYIAMLQSPSTTPVPGSRLDAFVDRIFSPKPTNWVPKPLLFLSILLLNYSAFFLAPSTVGTASFVPVAVLSKLFFFAPLIMPAIVPESWGVVWPDPRGSYSAFTKLFRLVSVASSLLHAKTTLSALWYNLPDAWQHRHSVKLPFDTEKRSAWERSATAAEKVIGSMKDHPVVAAAGMDVLLCALSLGLWAAVRGMDVNNMLKSAVPYYQDSSEASTAEDHNVKTETTEPLEEDDAVKASPEPELSMSLRSRSLRGKPGAADLNISNSPDSEPLTPKRRGRPRKAKTEPKLVSELVSELEPEAGLEEVPADATYKPSPAVEASIIQGDVVPDDDFDWESASLAWGLTALGGLGAASAAVFGAECIAR